MPPSDSPSAQPLPRRFSLVRSFTSADFITLANAGSGMASVLCSMAYLESGSRAAIWSAIALLPVALVCDVLDGAVARHRKRSSPYGADLDSLSDIVSFGVAPAALGYALGFRGGWDGVALVYFVMCGISRLARFNATADALVTDKGKVSHFEGTPIPTSVLLVALLATALAGGNVHHQLWLGEYALGPFVLHPLVLCYVLSGSGMITARLRIPKP